jgi:hypothetical protein
MKRLLYIICLLVPTIGWGQGRINITSAYINISGGVKATPVYVVVGNPATTAISRSTSGGIISEGEFNQVLWNIGTSTGSYVVPFVNTVTAGDYYIPLTYNITTAAVLNGVHTGGMVFATYGGESAENYSIPNEYDNTLYMPLQVTSMDNKATGTDDSKYVVDRFWIIDGLNYSNPNYYSTPPAATITFSFTDGSMYTEIGTNNTITEANLEAQRWNSTSGTWGDWTGAATITAGGASKVATAAGVAVTTANMFRAWTLVDNTQPLPIQLVSFTADCNNATALLKWTTATETNNDYFTIERTLDGVNYQVVTTIKGAGNSSTAHNYSAIDESPLNGVSYYRISQTDFDGTVTHLNTIVYQPCGDEESINAFTLNNSIIDVQINSNTDEVYTLTIMNTLGQRIVTETKGVKMGMNDYRLNPKVVHGTYIIQVVGKDKVYSKKLYLGNL